MNRHPAILEPALSRLPQIAQGGSAQLTTEVKLARNPFYRKLLHRTLYRLQCSIRLMTIQKLALATRLLYSLPLPA